MVVSALVQLTFIKAGSDEQPVPEMVGVMSTVATLPGMLTSAVYATAAEAVQLVAVTEPPAGTAPLVTVSDEAPAAVMAKTVPTDASAMIDLRIFFPLLEKMHS